MAARHGHKYVLRLCVWRVFETIKHHQANGRDRFPSQLVQFIVYESEKR